MGMPAGTVPVTVVREGETTTQGRSTNGRAESAAIRAERGSVGLPIGVQVVDHLGVTFGLAGHGRN